MNANAYLIKREVWEHHAFWIVPAVLAVLTALVALYGGAMYIYAAHTGVLTDQLGAGFSPPDPARQVRIVHELLFASSVPFNAALLIVTAFYLLDSLYADRRDRSILFWKSLPVSDLATVTSKLFTAMFVAPAIMLAILIALHLVLAVVMIIASLLAGTGAWRLALHPLAAIGSWGTIAYALMAQSLWYIPFFGWFLLASAWARKAPFLWAVLPPVVIAILEGWIFGTAHVANLIGRQAAGVFPLALEVHHGSVSVATIQGHEGMTDGMLTTAAVGRFFSSAQLWIGVAVGLVFTGGAVWLRRYRDDS